LSDLAAPPGIFIAQWRRFALAAAVLALAFAVPLWRLFWFAITDDLYSYIPLMPAVSAYLAWILKPEIPRHSPPARKLAIFFLAAGAAALTGYFLLAHTAALAPIPNGLALSTLAWLLCLAGAGCWFLGGAAMRSLAFPFALLLFMIPLPVGLRNVIETGLQHGSALAADWMFVLAGTPVCRTGLVFALPGFNMEVAPECSGIHSTWVLFITSLVAGRMILRRPFNRVVLCLAVIPLALLRNGFRVFVIGELCVHVSPRMIDSPIHRHGGPLFFMLSLVPFFLLVYFLRKSERRGVAAATMKKSEK
jgi:exosortase C (VPDSG-CTERM-specific)